MRFHTSRERARRTAKRLRDAVNVRCPSPVPLTLGGAQKALAVAWGYGDWVELDQCCEERIGTPLDRDSASDVVATRRERQAMAIASTLGIALADAVAIVTAVRPTCASPVPNPGRAASETFAGIPLAPPGPGSTVWYNHFQDIRLGLDTEGMNVWLADYDLRGGVAVRGGDDARRRALLHGMLRQRFARHLGCLLVDDDVTGQAVDAFLRLASAHGRSSEVDVVDLRPGYRSTNGHARLGVGLFAEADATTLSSLLDRVMFAPSTDNNWWRGMHAGFLSCAVALAVHRRDALAETFDLQAVKRVLTLESVVDAAGDPGLPDTVRKPILSYLDAFPGYRPDQRYQQTVLVTDKFGIAAMQIGEMLDDLSWMVAPRAHASPVDVVEAVCQGRTVIVRLPPPDHGQRWEAAFVVALVGHALANLAPVEPSNREPPHLVLLDGSDRYEVESFDAVASSASDANVAVVYGIGDRHPIELDGREPSGRLGLSAATRIVLSQAIRDGKVGTDPAPWADAVVHRSNQCRVSVMLDT